MFGITSANSITNIKRMREIGDQIAQGAAMMTDTTVTSRVLGSAWPQHFNRPVAEAARKHQAGRATAVGRRRSEARESIATRLKSREQGLATQLDDLSGPVPDEQRNRGGSDDIGDVSWNVPTITVRYPSNIPGLPGHNWANAVTMATPIAHKGVVAGAKVVGMTVIDLLTKPELVDQAWKYFRECKRRIRVPTPHWTGR